MSAGQSDVVLDVKLKTSGVEVANMQMVGTFKNTERAARQSAAAVKQASAQMSVLGTQMNKLWRSAMYGVVSYAAVSGIRKAFGGVAQSIREVTDTRVVFQRAMTPLLSLGRNTGQIGALSRKVVDMALAFGKAGEGTAPISDFIYNLQSGSFGVSAKNLGEVEKATLSLSKAVGLDLPTAMDLNLKTWHAYGKEVGSVIKIQNMLKKTTDDAYLSFQEMAEGFPTVAGTAANLGIPIEEILSAVMVGSQTTGDPSVLFTGLRNIVLAMERLDQKGIHLKGTFTEIIEQIKEMPEIWKEFDMRQAATLSSIMVADKGVLSDYQAELRNLSNTQLETDKVISEKLKDRNILYAEQIDFLQRIGELSPLQNMLIRGQESTSFADTARKRYEVGTAYYKGGSPEWARWTAPLEGLLSALIPSRGKRLEEQMAGQMFSVGAPGGKEWLENIWREKRLKAYDEEVKKLKDATEALSELKKQVAANANSPFPYDPGTIAKAEADLKNLSESVRWAKARLDVLSEKPVDYKGAKDWKDNKGFYGKLTGLDAVLGGEYAGAPIDLTAGIPNDVPAPKGKGRIKGPGGEWIEYDPNKKSQGAINKEAWLSSPERNRGKANTAAWLAEKEAKKNPGMTGPKGEYVKYSDRATRRAAEAAKIAAESGEYVPLAKRGGKWADRFAASKEENYSFDVESMKSDYEAGTLAGRQASIPHGEGEGEAGIGYKKARSSVLHPDTLGWEPFGYSKERGTARNIVNSPGAGITMPPFDTSKLDEMIRILREQSNTQKETLAAVKVSGASARNTRRPTMSMGANTVPE